MSENQYEELSDHLGEALNTVQAKHKDINPIIGVNRQMRKAGIPADLFTVDCLKTNRRILLVLHDQMPDVVQYQFGYREQDPGETFETIPFVKATSEFLSTLMIDYFSKPIDAIDATK